MGLAGDNDLIAPKEGLIQAGELESLVKEEREMEEEEENMATKRQRYDIMT